MPHFIDNLPPKTTVLTPNRRLSAILIKHDHNQHSKKNQFTWETPDILPIQSWLRRLWDEFTLRSIAHHPILLSSQQETALWKKVLAQSHEGEQLLQIAQTADTARKAWGLLKSWRIDYQNDTLNVTEDCQAFQRWAFTFQQQLTENHWIDAASLPDQLAEKIQQQLIPLPDKIILYGFTEISPQQQFLFDLIQQKCNVVLQDAHQTNVSTYQLRCQDDESEIRTMAAWAKSIYEKEKKQNSFIGCVIPTLEHSREMVLRIFRETFSEPGTTTMDHIHLPFNISAGRSLATLPLIRVALQLLRFQSNSLSAELLQTLLFSPFLASAEREKLSRAAFSMSLRDANISSISLEKLSQSHRKYDLQKTCPKLFQTLQNVVQCILPQQRTMSFHDWAHFFAEQLQTWGWPGERSLNSEEYQITQRWLELLTELTTFDCILDAVTQNEALKYLTHLAEKAIFQPKTPDAPIQISGIFEAAGLPFTHLWVMGLDDTQWPFPPRPNPFIPIKIQKKYKMPHASAERELEYCQQLFMQLKHSGKHVIFSHATQREDEILRPAVFLEALPSLSISELQLQNKVDTDAMIFQSQAIECIDDEMAPPITSDETIHGGTRIFKQQAACPFRAFAEIRLNVMPVSMPSIGLRAMDRGNILHKALEYFWQKIQDSQTLLSLSEEHLNQFIKECTQKAILFCTERDVNHERYLQLECQRLSHLMHRYIVIEKNRPSFRVVAYEKELQTTIGNIPVKLRIDRIDEIEDQAQMIIDYKTGKNHSLQNWLGERPDEPQLPLYAISGDTRIAAIAFAKLNAEMIGYTGISKEDFMITGIQSLNAITKGTVTWENQIAFWQQTLTQLADQFYTGIASINPKYGQQTCQTCQLQSLCRIHERVT